jgi:hypothetical protein
MAAAAITMGWRVRLVAEMANPTCCRTVAQRSHTGTVIRFTVASARARKGDATLGHVFL